MDEDKHVEEKDNFHELISDSDIYVCLIEREIIERESFERIPCQMECRDDCKLHLNKTKEGYTRK